MAGSGTWSSASHPASSRKAAPQCPRTKTQAQHPRGSGGTFSFASHLRDEDFLTEGGTYNTRRRPQRAGPCGKAAAQGDPPRSRPRSGYPPSFLRLPRVLGLRLCASPPEARPSRRMARGVPKGPNRRFDRRSYRLNGGPAGGGGGAPGGRRELFSFRNPAPTLRNPRL